MRKLKIKKDDFKLDVGYLSGLLFCNHNYKIPNNIPYYELVFEGKFENGHPQKGELYIKNVFKFEGEWSTTPGNYKGTLYDLVDKTQKEIHVIDGIDATKLPQSKN
jgi:hypothetical protein